MGWSQEAARSASNPLDVMKPSRRRRRKLYSKAGALAATRPALGRPVVPRSSLKWVDEAHIRRFRIPPQELAWNCDPAIFPFRTTRDVAPLKGWVGQSQALRSLKLGLSVTSLDYNVFVCGLSGADVSSRLQGHIRSLRLPRRAVPDRCYVQNFADPLRPRLLELEPGAGARLEKEVHRLLRRIHAALNKQPEKKWRSKAREIIGKHLPAVLKSFREPEVRRWLREWRRSLLDNVHHAMIEDYRVNHLRGPAGAKMPVVAEHVPQAGNLLGWIGKRPMGDQPAVPHFTEIRGGAVLEADGGVLIVNSADFQPGSTAWTALKACMKYGVLQIEEGDLQAGSRPGGLRPEPIKVQVKVVLLGDYGLYDHLLETDPDFGDLFKVRVDFDSDVDLTARILKKAYPAFIRRVCEENDLRPLSAPAVARVLEFAVRKGGRKNKITTQSWLIADLLREANYWASVQGHSVVTPSDVRRAVSESVLRLNLVETKISEMIQEGTILISTRGSCVGQVNGLAVYDMGDYLFGKPSRITAETSYGQSGIINIERESGLSGRSHDKGVQILAGYLRSRFAQRRPMNLTASVCFEQSYSGVDGDSASATEIYAILSSLSGLPMRQDLAVTGSLNQKGDIQPIGGVNEKIEGFYDCIQAGRPTNDEGVIIPRKNVKDLMLREDVVRAVRKGRFHIYAIDTVEQGLEILTGVKAGRRLKSGKYTPGSAFALVDERLEEIANGLRKYQSGEDA